MITRDVTKADAVVFRLDKDRYGIYSVDVFSPIVEDPESFGRVVFANSISDICAMGGKPLVALNVCMFPLQVPVDKLNSILLGASKAAIENGVFIAGGHTTKNDELHYGLSVFGECKPENLRMANNARDGDHIILTKAIGTGIMFAAKDKVESLEWDSAVQSMMQTSIKASEILTHFGCRCSTDITGFGLVPHLFEVLEESKLSADIIPENIPLLPGVFDLANIYLCPVLSDNMGLVGNNFIAGDSDPRWMNICFDAQTSGGLLAFVSPNKSDECVIELKKAGYPASVIGSVSKGKPQVRLVTK